VEVNEVDLLHVDHGVKVVDQVEAQNLIVDQSQSTDQSQPVDQNTDQSQFTDRSQPVDQNTDQSLYIALSPLANLNLPAGLNLTEAAALEAGWLWLSALMALDLAVDTRTRA